jgi:hypothetical protein
MLGITHWNFTTAIRLTLFATMFQSQLQSGEWDGGEGIFRDVAHSDVLCQQPLEWITHIWKINSTDKIRQKRITISNLL